jgi:catecholate siderophore receptor
MASRSVKSIRSSARPPLTSAAVGIASAIIASAAQAQQGTQLPTIDVQGSSNGQVGYVATRTSTATKTDTPLLNVPQSVSVITKDFVRDQATQSVGDAIRYVPGVIPHQGEGNRDDVVIRGQRTNADFFVNGIRDDVQYFRDLYNVERIEVLKGSNAMIFGRGGGGGVINRVLKEADGVPVREVTGVVGSFDQKRVTLDVGQQVNQNVAARFNTMYENSDSFRDYFNLNRYGINPTVTVTPTDRTKIKLSYEHFHDNRITDRGIPSQLGTGFPLRPYETSVSTYFGNPDVNYTRADVNVADAVLEHDFESGLKLRNATRYAHIDRFYQNVYPAGGANAGAVNAAGTASNLSAYNNQTDRQNLFNQTDWTYKLATGSIQHTLLAGTEFGHQLGLSFREDGFFLGSTTIVVDPTNPTSFLPVTFRNTTGANSTYKLNLAAGYLQDQIEVTRWLQFVVGIRQDYFDLTSQDRRNGNTFQKDEHLTSPRAGIVIKPQENMSLYGSYSVSYLPSSGDQFSVLAPGTVIAAPEKFVNKEIGFKWDIYPTLQFTTAIYELDRTNQRLADPSNPGFFILSGKTETRGFEAGLNGYVTERWQMSGGYAYTDSHIASDTSATIRAGNRVGLVPYNTFTLWNKYQFAEAWYAGVGIIRYTDFFASSDDTVRLPDFTRVDMALYNKISPTFRWQVNAENVFNQKYYATADGNNNISPGSPRAVRVTGIMNF